MAEEKWGKLFHSSANYTWNLDRLARDFNKIWIENQPSPQKNLDDYKIITVLGAGAFGIVKLVKHKRNNQHFAVKIFEKDIVLKNKQLEHVKLEKRVLKGVCFPFLVYLEFSSKDNTCLYLGLPFINGGELFQYHQKMRKFTERQAKFYAAQVFLALEYLHYLDIVYRDLKTENILIDSKGYIKVTDFGFCKRIEGRTWTLCGTPEYLAPEIIKSKSYGKSVDWWSYGVLCYELVTGTTPFRSDEPIDMYEKICAGIYKVPQSFSKEFKLFTHSFLQVDVSRRIGTLKNGTKDIRDLEWLKEINWKALLEREIDPFYVPKISEIQYDFVPERYIVESNYDKHTELFRDF